VQDVRWYDRRLILYGAVLSFSIVAACYCFSLSIRCRHFVLCNTLHPFFFPSVILVPVISKASCDAVV
jgi:dolichyl-phosphate-mannose--protein O-mannosyl transferase